MKTKEQYIAPALTVVEFKTEKGYASSLKLVPGEKDGYNSQGMGNMDGDNSDNTFSGSSWTW